MDFLTLVQEVHRESGSGGTKPTSLVNLRGEALRLMNWVSRANTEIQELHSDWKFLWAQHTETVIASQASYSPLLGGGLTLSPSSLIGEYDRDTFFLDGNLLTAVNYLDVRSIAAPTTAGVPYQVVMMPDDSLRLDPPPATAGILKFDYWKTARLLVNNGDEPSMPARFQHAIIGKALMFYANFENAPEVLKTGQEMYGEWMLRLESDQLPGDRFQHSKAEDNDMVIEVE